MNKETVNPIFKAIRELRLNATLASVVYLLLGVVLVVAPTTSKNLLCTLVGVVVLIYGAFNLLAFLLDRDFGGLSIELIIGIAAASFGVFSLLNPGFLMDFLIIVLGLAIAVASAGSLKRALNLRAFGYGYWWISLLVAAATLLVALTFVFCPEVYGALLMQIIGIILIVEAIGDLLTIHRLSRIARDGGYTVR